MADRLDAAASDRPEARVLLTGTVTFLFTDIAGSTRLLRAGREAYAAALAEHRRLLRAAFAAHGGREVDTQGDSFFVAFQTAGQGVAAAAQAQRSLNAHPWPHDGRVLVRMGLHSGEATLAGESYIGLAVHRAARIAAAASGGQILLSDTTASLVRDQLSDGTALRSLGVHGLKDFPQSATLYQLDIAGLPTDFPPPRTLSHRPLPPVPAGELLGRDDDVAAVAALLTDPRARLVTLTGPGGIGKTRLALEVARTVADTFPGGAVFVPLSALTDPELVLPSVAEAVGARREPGVEPLDAVRLVLGDERTLLVLDNFEQVVAAAGEVAALLDAVPAAVVLVTSRQVLHLRSEQQYPLAPLAATPAERLFAERAAAVRPGFTLDVANATAVAEICRRLDGLPLAIELAAARVRLLPPAALLERLSARLDVLAGGPVDLPERQRTLRATMDWSFAVLARHEQALFIRLAVFSGGWTVAAAETVCGRPGEPDILAGLAALLDASLLVEPDESLGEPRLDMLETVRAYAAERLAASPERAEVERRHTAWMLAITDPVLMRRPGGFQDALVRFDLERANVRAAMQHLIDARDVVTAALLISHTFPFLIRRDAEREAMGWLDQILRSAAVAPAEVRGRLLIHRAAVGIRVGDASVRPLLEEGRRLVPDDPDHALDRVRAAMASYYVALVSGSVEEASRYVDELAARYAALGHELGLAGAAHFRGDLALLGGDLEAAERHYTAALELAARHDDDLQIGAVLSILGLLHMARGDIPGARRFILDAPVVNRHAGPPSGIAYSLEGLGALALADGRPAAAARALAAAGAARQTVAQPLSPALTPLLDDLAARARQELGDEAYEAADEEGRRWPLLQALDRTLHELEDTARPIDTDTPTLRDPDVESAPPG
jgi:predicted ATPase/class 3 adenylate cyclase